MPESHSPRLAVFDCDGTLVDSQHSIISSMFSAFDARVHPRPEAEAVRQVVGLPLREAMVRLLPDAGPDDGTAAGTAAQLPLNCRSTDAQLLPN